jgi:murein L,D-transpeptidase YcbB/YkuD
LETHVTKLLARTAFAALLAAFAATSALAQDVASLEVTRIVIAPPQNPLAETIKAGLAASYERARPDSAAGRDAQQLYYFYGARHFEPLWLDLEADGAVSFSPAAEKILAIFEEAESEGLRPQDYLTPAIDIATAGNDPQSLAGLETAFSAAVVRYATHIHTGRIRPSDVSTYFDIQPKQIDESTLLMRLAGTDTPAAIFAELEPQHPEFQALKAALAAFDENTVDRPEPIQNGPLLKVGMTDPRVPVIRHRLEVPIPQTDPYLYDEALYKAVKSFQAGLSLQDDGVIGPATVAAFNGGDAVTRADIIANMERWRWMPEDLGEFHVMVNVPEFRVAISDHGEEVYSTRVVVGTSKNQTPIFSDSIRHIVVNPYWNVPSSIVENEIAPAVLRNPGYIDSQNMELLFNGSAVSSYSVNWSIVSPDNFPFKIRQRPGPGNALGRIKFLFPNKHDVYLHDTPSKSLFSRGFRAFSHGCIRVQNPMDFAEALLANEPVLDRAKLESLFGPSERWVNPEYQIPVHIAYFTLRVEEDGTIRSFADVYGHNERLIELMGLDPV